jgi:hypothetical protein
VACNFSRMILFHVFSCVRHNVMFIEDCIILPRNTNSGFFMLPADMKCGCYKE